ncbi:MAG: hypothetical protein NVS1B9_09710 [Solirubrobacteraceae bacterium]
MPATTLPNNDDPALAERERVSSAPGTAEHTGREHWTPRVEVVQRGPDQQTLADLADDRGPAGAAADLLA